MLIIIFNILIWISTIILLTVFVLFTTWVLTGYKARVPFISVPSSVLPDIHSIMKVEKDSTVYDLGCGDGRVLFYLSKFVPNAKYIGIENSPVPLLISKLKSWFYKRFFKRNINIIKGNFSIYDLSKSTHIFTYLYPNVMDELLTKFENELKPGTKLFSMSFRFTLRQPSAVFDLQRSKYKLARKIYVYEF